MNYRFRCIITIFAEAFFVIEILSVDPIQHWQHFEWTLYCACVMCMCVLHIGFLTQYSGKLAMNGKNTEIAFFVNCKSKAQKRFFSFSFNSLLLSKPFKWKWFPLELYAYTISLGFQYAHRLRLHSNQNQYFANIFNFKLSVFSVYPNILPSIWLKLDTTKTSLINII